MKLLARVPGQSFQLAHGPAYRADENRVVHDVDPRDVAELRRVGCTDMLPEAMLPEAPLEIHNEPASATPVSGSLAELAASLPDSDSAVTAPAPVDPVAPAIVQAAEQAKQ